MGEVYSWNEGQIFVWTGSATASARVAYATNIDLAFKRPFINRRTMGGAYYNLESDRRVDVNIGAMFSNSMELWNIFQSATAVHMRVEHSAQPNGSAGFVLYSGVMTDFSIIGSDRETFSYQMAYYANEWSGYGG